MWVEVDVWRFVGNEVVVVVVVACLWFSDDFLF